ncbi:diguanylate cyclase [Novosphingobium sp. PS1R-30]|uniref:diguanylate cyclase n=1 Tax=Novosphingobium anseongense TaxID=3133436 RepID=A0ABU8RUS4_9SPHN|nr:MAG: diguanylate cyclase [Novosphingobium sp.]
MLGLRTKPSDSKSTKSDVMKQARRQVLDAICDFLLDNDLAITPDNLLAAHGAFAGGNPGLARQIAARQQSGARVEQDWLDEVTANQATERKDVAIERLIGKLEQNLDAFTKSSKAAHRASSDYSTKLEAHVVELEQVEDTGQIITGLADLAKAMAERTRQVEQEMRKSEEEAKSLRRHLDRAKRDAEVDHLTGLPNRRAFEALLDKHYREAQAEVDSLSVAFCDIDHFKKVNDTHGHDAGDRVIKLIGEALARISNDNCHVARHGGEEFVMLFRGLTTQEAKQRLDEAREEMAARKLINRRTDEPIGQITFSGGVANVFGYENPRAALKAADEALYKAKQGGRNQVHLA